MVEWGIVVGGFRVGSIINWGRVAASAVADAVPAAAVALPSAVPLPSPMTEPLDWVVVCAHNGMIVELSESMTFDAARSYQIKVQESNYGEVAAHIVKKSTAAMLKEGMLSTAILDTMESQLAAGYSLLLDSHHRFKF